VTVAARMLRDFHRADDADTAIGIAPHSLQRIGRQFEQARASSPRLSRSGLGLAIAGR